MSNILVAGYCKLCRAKEIERFGKVLNTAGKRHYLACRDAGCGHPPAYKVLNPEAKEAVKGKVYER